MRHVGPCLIWLALARAALPADAPARPTLVLDARGHTSRVNRLMFTPDGRELITVSDDKTIRTWDVASGEPLRVLRPPIGPGPEGALHAAALSPDGRTLAVGGHTAPDGAANFPIYLIDLAAGRIARLLTGHTEEVFALAFSPDGVRLASGSGDHTARVWDTRRGASERVLVGHTDGISGVCFAPDGRRLATASLDKTGRIWSVADGRSEAVLRGHEAEITCVAWRPDGKVIATGSNDQNIRQWASDGSEVRGFEGLGNSILSLAFSADSRDLLVTRAGPTLNFTCSSMDLPTRRERVRFDRHATNVKCGAFSPDGTLAATADVSGDVYIWKTTDASTIHHLASRGRGVKAVAWGNNGHGLAWGSTERLTSPNDRVPLEQIFLPEELEQADNVGPGPRRAQTSLESLTLERDGKTTVAVKRAGVTVATLAMPARRGIFCYSLLSGGRAAVGNAIGLYLFDARSGKLIRKFLGHSAGVGAVAPSPDGRFLLSGSGDRTLRVWDPDRDEPLLSLFVAGEEWVAWTPEGYYAASPGGEALMGWQVGNGKDTMADFYPAAKFRRTLYRPDVIKLLLSTGSTRRALEDADRARGRESRPTEAAKVLPPEVEVAAPRHGATLATARMEVKAIARPRGGHPVTTLRLLLDGRPYRGPAGVKAYNPPRDGQVRESWAVELGPGPHTLAVQADSAVSQGTSDPVDVTVAAADPAATVELPALYVLAVGVSEYPGDLRLHYAAKDAEAIEEAFRIKSKPLFRAVEVRRLTDAKATRREILAGLTWLRKSMTQKDVGVVFFSGHGMRDAEGSLYLLPVDGDPDDLLATAVADAQLKPALAGMPGRVIALLDACHAGAAGGDHRKGPPGGLTDDLVRDLVTDDYGVIVMASSTGRESSLENNAKRQSNFTLALVEGLSGAADANKDGAVYLNELDAYVTDRVKALTKGQQHPVTAKPTSIRSFPLARP